MRLWIISDLHLEFGAAPLLPPVTADCDVIVMAGDIAGGCAASIAWIAGEELFRRHPVIYLPGNHEHYHDVLQDDVTEGFAASEAANAMRLAPIHFLVRRAIVIGDVRFVGCTLWTDYRLDGTPKPSMVVAGQTMNDHRLVRYREETGHVARFMPWHAAAEHRKDLAFLVEELEKPHDGPTVVVTHHLPSARSISRQFIGSSLNSAFASHLDWLIERHQPALWVHGHTHDACDYSIGISRIVCNPQGYLHGKPALRPDGKPRNGFDPECVVEIDR
jgi:Icc-related predicted phosphoesterase